MKLIRWTILFIIGFCLALMISALFTSCYTPQKAARQLDKAISRQPEIAAAKTRTAFPCIVKSVDSTAYLSWLHKFDSLLESFQNESLAKDERINEISDSLRSLQQQPKDSLFSDCAQETEGLIQYAARMQRKSEQQDKLITALKNAAANPPPVTAQIADSADIYLAQSETKRQADTAAKYRTLYQQDHAWREAREKREAGHMVIYIPWKWIIVIAILLCAWVFIQWRAGGIKKLLNHIKT